jgi:opacity protein-like surface antigen
MNKLIVFVSFISFSFFSVTNLYSHGLYLNASSGYSFMKSDEKGMFKGNIGIKEYQFNDTTTWYKPSVLKSFKIGYKSNSIRFDIEHFVHKNSIYNMVVESLKAKFNNVDSSSYSDFSTIFTNFYYDFGQEEDLFTPFLGFGIGSTTIDVVRQYEGISLSESSTQKTTSYHITSGVQTKMTDSISFDLVARAIKYQDISFKDSENNLLTQSYGIAFSLMFGMSYMF